jgi:hypothetical protein
MQTADYSRAAQAQVGVQGSVTSKRETAADAARQLAHLMERQMGFNNGTFNPNVLRLFLHAYWDRVSTLAHAIHADQD